VGKYFDIFRDKIFIMDNILDLYEVQDLIKHHLEEERQFRGKIKIEKVDPELINIILPKSFKGNPLFLTDIVDSLIVFGFNIRIVINMFSILVKSCLPLQN
jgi:hypothetical protein